MTSLKRKFGKRLKELRKSKGLIQEQLAELINIEPPNISRIESGTHFPQPENIEKIAQVLNISVKELFDFEHFDEKTILSAGYVYQSATDFHAKKPSLV